MARRKSSDGKTAKIVMSVFIALIMILSVFGVIIGSYTSELKYGKQKFTINEQGQYLTDIDDVQTVFYTLPPDALVLNVSQSAIQRMLDSSLLITTFNPRLANDSLPYIEVSRFDIAAGMKDKFIINSVSEFSSEYAALAIVDCANASVEAPVIFFNSSDTMSVYETGNCVYVNGRGSDFLRFRDRVLYEYYGVIKDGKIS